MGQIRNALQPVGQPEPLGPFAVGRPEVPDEAGGDVRLGTGEGLQEGTRGTASGEPTGVREFGNEGPAGKQAPRSWSELQPFGITVTEPRGAIARIWLAIAPEAATIAFARRATCRASAPSPADVTTTVWVRGDRITEVGDPTGRPSA